MNNDKALYGIGTIFVAAVSASLLFGWAHGAVETDTTAAISAPDDNRAGTERVIRVVLDSPYAR
jgi:hypothetical protein